MYVNGLIRMYSMYMYANRYRLKAYSELSERVRIFLYAPFNLLSELSREVVLGLVELSDMGVDML
jgi:hypothetical protein